MKGLACVLVAWPVLGLAQVPSLDSLAGKWLSGPEIVFPPSVTNTTGALGCTENLTGFQFCAFPPVAQGGQAAVLLVDGKPLAATSFRWFPYQALRRATLDGLEFQSATRLGSKSPDVAIHVGIHNPTNRVIQATLSLANPTGFRKVPGVWDWNNRGVDPNDGFRHDVTTDAETIVDTKSGTQFTVRSQLLHAKVTFAPGQTREFDIDCGCGPGSRSAKGVFDEAFRGWNARWKAAFGPGNRIYSGNLPTLETADAKLKRTYYMSIVTLLAMERTDFPHAKRCFVTVGPEYGTTLEYFWDTALFANIYSLLDPVNARANLEAWFTVDIHHHYAIDYLTGEGVGPWYAPNDFSVFTTCWKYGTVAGGPAFMHANADRFRAWAEFWKTLVRPGEKLADFGDNDNLLECSPAYVNMVPSLNAAQVGLMRDAASVAAPEKRDALLEDADRLAQAVLAQYVPGDGVWLTKHRDGSTVANRHVYDYLTIGLSMTQDLDAKHRAEMTAFVNRELLADGWIRAMSLSDPHAAESDRPDHGPKGAYPGWPALAGLTMAKFGQFDSMMSLIHRCEAATWQGPYPQGFELLQVPGTDRWIPRIARRGCDYNESCGAAFAETVIAGLFGVEWNIDGTPRLDSKTVPRPVSARLTNLRTRTGLRRVECGPFGVRWA